MTPRGRTYSYSKLSTFDQCPQKYRFRYVERVKVDLGPSIEAFLGSRVHEALEWLYDLLLHGKVSSADDLLATYERAWAAAWSEEVRIVRHDLSAEDYRTVGRDLLQRYYARHAPFEKGLVLGLERPFRFALDGEHSLNGFMDRLMRAEGEVIEVHDYKTGGRLATPEEAATDRQAGVYDLAASHLFPDAAEIRLVWHYLRFDEQRISSRTPLEREALRQELLAAMRRIESEATFAPKESGLCDWCEFYDLCPAKAHGRLIRDAQAHEESPAHDGVALVDRLVALREELAARRKEVERGIEEIEGQLVAFASAEGLSTVLGTNHEAVIDREPKLVFPGAADPQRESLEEALREVGLWEQVADVSLARLRSLLASGAIEEEVAVGLREYATVEPRATVRLRKRADIKP
jgi:RecB family exonuclease